MHKIHSPSKQLAVTFLREFEELLQRVNLDAIERVYQILRGARDRGATVYLAGNGGSAATAAHWVNDLGKGAKESRRLPLRVMSLSDNVSWLTALANDEGYERVFAGQLENFAKANDVLVVLSASGNSPNLLRAVEMARARKLKTIGFLGFDGGVLKDMVDEVLLLPTRKGAYGLVESGHDLFCHILTACLAADRAAAENVPARASA
ncbi:MAG: D-sedoheptulose-7-phosphate isomerase [Candidatus Binatia bacterium]